jgi:hypothetical protein
MGKNRKVYKVLVGKLEGKRPLEKPKCRWEDEIRIDLREIGWGGVERIKLAQDRGWWRAVMNAVLNLWVLSSRSLFVRSDLEQLSSYKMTLVHSHNDKLCDK